MIKVILNVMATSETDGGGLAPNDPYRGMERSDVEPNIGVSGGRGAQSVGAQDRLAAAEENAMGTPASVESGGVEAAKTAEANQEYAPRYSGTGRSADRDEKKGKGRLFRKGPLIAIMMMVMTGGGLMMGAQLLFPFHFVERATGMFDGSYTSRTARMATFTKWLFNLENDETRMTKYAGVFKRTQKFRRIGASKQARLADQGITVLQKGSTIPTDTIIPEGTTLRLTDGTEMTLANDVQMRPGHTVLEGATLRDGALIYRGRDADTLVSANKYGEYYETNREFRNDFNRGARSWVGRIAAWVDLSVARFLGNHGITRNIFKNWRNRVIDAEGADTSFADIMNGVKPAGRTPSRFNSDSVETGRVDGDGDALPDARTRGNVDAMSTLNNIAKTASNMACAVSAVSATISAIKTAQALGNARMYVSSIFEAVDRVKYGDGSDSPINEVNNEMTRKDMNGNTMVDAEGMRVIVSGASYAPDRNDPVVLLTNIEEVFRNAGATVGALIGCSVSKAAFAAVSFALTIFSFGTFSIGKALLDIGIGTVVGLVISAGVSAIIQGAQTDFCLDSDDALVKGSCAALGSNSYLSGNFQLGGGTPGTKEKVAEFYDANRQALVLEAELDRQARSPFDLTSSNTFLGSIVAQMVPYALQGFSASGIFSMVGSVAGSSLAKMIPTAGAYDKAQYLSNMIGDCPNLESIGAVGFVDCSPIFISDMDTMDDDPEQLSYDLFCASWSDDGTKCTSGRSGSGNSGEKNFEGECISEESGSERCLEYVARTDSNDVEIINPKSNMGKFLLYCSEKTSPFGIIDQNVIQMEANFWTASTDSPALNSVANSMVGGVPLIGDIAEFVNGWREIMALPWATGSNCIAREDETDYLSNAARNGRAKDDRGNMVGTLGGESVPTDWDSVSWAEMSQYQRFYEDDRLLQSIDANYKSPVVAFWDRMEAEYPTDWSYEGVLARQTGMTKEQVIAGLAEIEKEEFLAQYDPHGLAPVVVEDKEIDLVELAPDGVIADHSGVPMVGYVIYYDVRNRSFAV